MRIFASHGTLYLKLFLVAVIAASMNAELNYVQLETDARNLIGNEEICNKFDVVILGDVFYDSEIATLLIPWLKLLLKHDKVVSFFDEFLRCIRKASFYFFIIQGFNRRPRPTRFGFQFKIEVVIKLIVTGQCKERESRL